MHSMFHSALSYLLSREWQRSPESVASLNPPCTGPLLPGPLPDLPAPHGVRQQLQHQKVPFPVHDNVAQILFGKKNLAKSISPIVQGFPCDQTLVQEGFLGKSQEMDVEELSLNQQDP